MMHLQDKLRAKVFSPVEGWVSVKCLAPPQKSLA